MASTVRYDNEFPTQQEALAYMEEELTRFPPEGYDTFVAMSPFIREDRTWFLVTVSRLTSCD